MYLLKRIDGTLTQNNYFYNLIIISNALILLRMLHSKYDLNNYVIISIKSEG